MFFALIYNSDTPIFTIEFFVELLSHNGAPVPAPIITTFSSSNMIMAQK